MPPTTSALRLTGTGEAKLLNAIRAAREAARISVIDATLALRAEVAARAPSETEEGRMLSRGVNTNQAGGLGFGIGLIGTPAGGRFLRLGEMVSVREAILTERIQTASQGDRFLAGIGDPAQINPRTGFSWRTQRRGIEGPTLPFNRAYLQALENGGLVWQVVPRPTNRSQRLAPEPGITVRAMVKTLPPQRMYRGTLYARQAGIRERIMADIRQAVRQVGRP